MFLLLLRKRIPRIFVRKTGRTLPLMIFVGEGALVYRRGIDVVFLLFSRSGSPGGGENDYLILRAVLLIIRIGKERNRIRFVSDSFVLHGIHGAVPSKRDFTTLYQREYYYYYLFHFPLLLRE